MSKRRRSRRSTWRRNARGNVEYRFGDIWLEHYRTVGTKTERDKIVKKLRSQGYQVRTKKNVHGDYTICRRKK